MTDQRWAEIEGLPQWPGRHRNVIDLVELISIVDKIGSSQWQLRSEHQIY
jgi:hypothetical protein